MNIHSREGVLPFRDAEVQRERDVVADRMAELRHLPLNVAADVVRVQDAVQALKRGARVGDAALVGPAVRTLREHHTDRAIYRIALAGDPQLTLEGWEDLLAGDRLT